MSHLTPEGVVIARSGEVRLRTSNRMRPVLGKVLRDPQNPKRWVAMNKRGLPVGTKTETRKAALDQLTDYIDHTVLETVPVSEHVSLSTGPTQVIEQKTRTPLPQRLIEVGVGALGLVPLGILIFGLLTWQ